MNHLTNHHDTFCPPGHRFVIQLVDEPTKQAALDRFGRIFGAEKQAKVVIVPGCSIPPIGCFQRGRFNRPGIYRQGFRCYLPVETQPCHSRSTSGPGAASGNGAQRGK